MKLGDVRERVDEMRVMNAKKPYPDDPALHIMEDELYEDVLRTIAATRDSFGYAELAEEALKTKELKFSRWYE